MFSITGGRGSVAVANGAFKQASTYLRATSASTGVNSGNKYFALDLGMNFQKADGSSTGDKYTGNTTDDRGNIHFVYMQTYKDNWANWKTIIPNFSLANYNGYTYSSAQNVATYLDNASSLNVGHGLTESNRVGNIDSKVSTWATNLNNGASYLASAKTQAGYATKVSSKYTDLTSAISNADAIYAGGSAPYTYTSWTNFANAYNAARAHMAALSPVGTNNQYSTIDADLTALSNALNNARTALEYRTYDVTYENLFSLSSWVNSSCSSGVMYLRSDNQTLDTDALSYNTATGTLSLTWDSANSDTSTYCCRSNIWADTSNLYTIPVTAGKSYVIEVDVESDYSNQSVAVGNLCLFATGGTEGDANEKNVKVGSNVYEFTIDNSCNKMVVRFDNLYSGTTIKFSNIAIYEKIRADEVDLANWDARPVREVYNYDDPLGTTLDVPVREGYTFNGWWVDTVNPNGKKDEGEQITDGNGNVVSDLQNFAITQNWILYSEWTINKYTITWVDGDGNTLTTTECAYGETPEYTGDTPTKSPDDTNHYTFNSWSPDIATVTEDATYTAQFTGEKHDYSYKADNYKGQDVHAETCSSCGHSKNVAHTEETRKENEVEPTYDKVGSYILVTYCSVCDAVIKSEDKTSPMLEDTNAPVIILTGKGSTDDTFCKEVSVTVADETTITLTVTKDGEEYTVADTYNFSLTEAGTYVITATDASNNTVTKTITVNADHSVDTWTKVENDNDNHSGTCTVCGGTVTAPHSFTNPVLTRPNLVDGNWTDGKYTYICVCGETKEDTAKRADYTAFDEAVAKLKELATYENFTNEVKATILNYATELENGTFDPDGDGTPNIPLNYVADYAYNDVTIPGEQATLNALVAELEGLVAEIEGSKNDPQFIKPDFTEILAEWEEYLSLVKQYGGEVTYEKKGDSTTATVVSDGYIKDATNEEVINVFDYLLENAYNSDSATEKAWGDQIAEMTATLSAINEGIKNGTLRDPNFEDYDEEVKIYGKETSQADISIEDAQAVEDAIATVDAIRDNKDSTAAENDVIIAEKTDIICAINEKYAVCVEGTHDDADATCTEPKTCSICGSTEGEANGHIWRTEPDSAELPVYDEETATWSQGVYTYSCENCLETATIYADRANYSEYDALVKAYDDIVYNDEVWSSLTYETVEALTEYIVKLDGIAQDFTKATTDAETGITTPDGQTELDALLEGLDLEIEAIKKSIEDGSGRMLDFTEFDETVSEYEGNPDDPADSTEDIASSEDRETITNLINEIRGLSAIEPIPNAVSEEQRKIDAATEEIRAIIDKYADCLENGHLWGEWTENIVLDDEGNFANASYTRICEKCDKVESYEVAHENYEAYDEAVAEAETLLNSEDLTVAAKEIIQNAFDEAKKLDPNLPADIIIWDDEDNGVEIDVNQNAEKIETATDALNAVIDSLYDENGELKDEYKKIDYTNYESAVNAYENLKNTMTDADKAAVEAIKAPIDAIPKDGTAAQYQTQVDKAAEDIAAINAKYGDCANGNHTWGEPVPTKEPTADAQGEYTETCGICGATQITEVDLADYDEFDAVVEELEDLLGTENLTDEAKQTIEDALADAEALDKNLPADVTTVGGQNVKGGQDEIDALVAELEKVVADTNDAIADGSALKPDYDAWEEAETAYDALDKTNVKDEIIAEADALKAEIAGKQGDDTLTQKTATQDDIDNATTRLNEIITGITDGSLRDPDYSKVEDKIDEANANDNLNKDTQDKIDAIEDALEEIKNKEPEANYKDDQDEVDALEDQLDEILDSIADGTATAPDYTEWDEAEGTYDALDKTNAPTDLVTEATNLKNAINALKDDPTANAADDQDTINTATDRLNEIIAEINGILTEKPDFIGYDNSHDVYEELVNQYGDKIKDNVADDVAALDAIVEDIRNDETATKVEDQNTIVEAKTQLDAIIAGIEDGSLLDADFTDAKEDLATAKDLAEKNDVIDGTKTAIENIEKALTDLEKDPTTNVKEDQPVIDALEKQLEEIIASITDGSLVKPDYTEVDKDLKDAKDKAEKNDVIDGVADTITNIEKALTDLKKDPTTNVKEDQPVIDALEKQLEEIITGITDGSLVKPDFTEADKVLADAKNKAENNDVIDGVKEDIKNIEDALNNIRTDTTATKADDQDDVDALKKQLEDIIAGINDGSLVKPDYKDAENAIKNAENLGDKLTDEEKQALEDLKDELEKIKNDSASNKKDNQEDVDAIKDAAQAIVEKYAECDKGNHAWGNPELTTKPTATENGEYTHTCTVCGETKTTKVKLANYDELNEVVTELENLAKTENLTDEAKKDIADALAKAEALDKQIPADATDDEGNVIKGGQNKINALVEELSKVVADTNAGIADGTLIKPDYTEVDKDLATAKDLAEKSNVIDGVKDDIKDIEDKLNEIKKDPTSNYDDDQDDVDALEDALEKIIAGIEDGSLVKPDYTDADKAIEEAETGNEDGKLSDEDQKALEDLKNKLDDIRNDPTTNKKDNQDDVDEIKDAVLVIVNKYAECAKGNHTYESKNVLPTCTEKGYTLHTCKVCGHSNKDNYVDAKGHDEVELEAVEATCSLTGLTAGKKCVVCGTITVEQQVIPTLSHTDEDGDGTCDVCGKTGLYDGCSCLCHNNNWFWRIVYIIFRIVWKIFNIHRVCPCGAIHY